jgi:N-acetylglucosaminyldiphosphoundecaprenol N-acetyl-beta-D-mannosaminyltransferase
MSKTRYYNIDMDLLDTPETLTRCLEYLESDSNHIVFFMNAHCFNIAQKNSKYRDSLNRSDILLNDGIGIKLGANKIGIHIKENMNGTDFIPKLLEFARDHNKNVYLLGGSDGIATLAAQKMQQKIKGISIVGSRHGYFEFDNDEEVIDDIIQKKTEILIAGMGVPRQELWLTKNKEKLKGVKISVAGGAILDFLSENVARAPGWMQKTGLEWVFRLLQEPRRLFKRYFVGIPLFHYYIFKLKH